MMWQAFAEELEKLADSQKPAEGAPRPPKAPPVPKAKQPKSPRLAVPQPPSPPSISTNLSKVGMAKIAVLGRIAGAIARGEKKLRAGPVGNAVPILAGLGGAYLTLTAGKRARKAQLRRRQERREKLLQSQLTVPPLAEF